MVATTWPRKFVPTDLNPADFSKLEPLYRALLERPLETAAQAEQWLSDYSELTSVVDEYGNRRYIDKSCHTDDPAIEKAFLQFVEEIEPKIKPLAFELQKRFLESPAAKQLSGQRYSMLIRRWKADVEIFREQNVPLETEVTKLNNEYDKISGAMTVEFRGKEYTLQQLARFVEEPDRETRRQAWELTARRRLRDRAAIDDIYDKQLPIRQKIAQNAGLQDYRAYAWKSYKRFDYTPEDCLRFADAIEQSCVPVVRELDRQRRAALRVDRQVPGA